MMVFANGDREIRVNFGVLSGREVTAAEIEELARELHGRLSAFSIVSEQRYEFAGDVEASIHQVNIQVESPIETELRGRLLEIVERWAASCAADRHADIVTPYPGEIEPVELPSA